MTNPAYVMFDSHLGDIPLATAVQGTVFSTMQVGTLTATGTASLVTTQVGSLSVTQIAGRGSYVANGATGVTVTVGGLTATSILAFQLATAGGSVGATPHALFPPNLTNGTVVLVATASDTSTYNVAALG